MRDTIIKIFEAACALSETVTEKSELKLLSLDSLSFIEALVQIEDTFGVTFDTDELYITDRQTVGNIIEITEKKINAEK